MEISLKALIRSLFLLFVLSFCVNAGVVRAATYDVCASGCAFTSLTDAFATSTLQSGDTITVGASYASSSETFPLNFPVAINSITLDCQNSGAMIGTNSGNSVNIHLNSSGNRVQNCSFSDAEIDGESVQNIAVQNNVFSSAATGTIFFSAVNNFNISGNENVNNLVLNNSVSGTIAGNDFRTRFPSHAAAGFDFFPLSFVSSTEVLFSGNQVNIDTPDINATAMFASSTNFVVDGNTFRYLQQPSVRSGNYDLSADGSTDLTFTNNYFFVPVTANSYLYLSAYSLSDSSRFTVSHNTFIFPNCPLFCVALKFSDTFFNDAEHGSVVATSTFNIFYSAPTTSTEKAEMISQSSSTSIILNDDYNDFWNAQYDGISTGTHDKVLDPLFKTKDADPSNDTELAPFSPLLDVNGTEDIGAYSGIRRNTAYVDPSGTIDYSTVDATNTADILPALRAGDTIQLASGTYAPFTLSSVSGVVLQGAGTSTVIEANATNTDVLTLDTVTGSTIKNLVVQDASTTQSAYTATSPIYHYAGSDYNDGGALDSKGLNTALVVHAPSCGIDFISPDDVSQIPEIGFHDMNLALARLVDFGNAKLTILVPNNLYSSPSALESDCAGYNLAVDLWVPSIFTASAGTFTYQPAPIATAGATFVTGLGLQYPPTITRVLSGYAGLKFSNSSNNTIRSVTSTNNGYNLEFTGSSSGNLIASSTLMSSPAYDVWSDASGNNTLRNTTFSAPLSYITGNGTVTSLYASRVQVTDQVSTPIPGVNVSLADAAGDATTTLTTGNDGYTGYTLLPAFVLSSSTVPSLTSGGLNPYDVAAAASSTYSATSTLQNLSAPLQNFTLVMHTAGAPPAPSSLTPTAATSSISLAWTDNSSGDDNETAFNLDTINLSNNETFPGTLSALPVDTTNTVVTSLLPNTRYQFRLSASNGVGTSSEATSSAIFTLALRPAAPTVSARTQNTITLNLASIANGNTASTTFAILNNTTSKYLDGSGNPQTSPTWAKASAWGTSLVAQSLSCNTSYSFSVVARNGDSVQTAFSPTISGSTASCPVSGGGGGGGSGSGSLAPLVTTYQIAQNGQLITGASTTTTGTQTGTPTDVTIITPPDTGSSQGGSSTTTQPAPTFPLDLTAPDVLTQTLGLTRDLPREALTTSQAKADAASFRLTITPSDADAIGIFIAYGNSPATKKLGQGERRALIRDYFDTLHTTSIRWDDIERLATGLIPLHRNLIQEQRQAPTVLQAFKLLFRHAPNFKNASDNLAWNTLMYRIRFPRDLVKEAKGITLFRTLMKHAPKTPFEWAEVRAGGYTASH
jgi:hypothetical protein